MYTSKYKKAESRFLHVLIKKKFKNAIAIYDELGITSQMLSNWKKTNVPLRYAGYLGRKYNFSPALLAYETHLILSHGKPTTYEQLLDKVNLFSKEEKEYILRGSYEDASKFIKGFDQEVHR